MKPVMLRTDYVANSNDSHWLTNPAAPLEGFSPLIGNERQPLGARTRLAHLQVRDRLAGADGLPGYKFDRASLQSILFSNRNLMAEILIDDLLAQCAGRRHVVLDGSGDYDLGPACDVLASWDRRDDLDSRGAYLFREFLLRLEMTGAHSKAFWREPFDPERPLETPRGIRSDYLAALEALATAAQAIEASGIALDVPLRQVQFVERGGRRIPIHGGPNSSVFNTMDMTHRIGVGYTDPVTSGATYIHIVSFEGGRPIVDALLVSGQTSDTTVPSHWEQTDLYSKKQWVRLPYLPEEVAKSAIGQSIVLREP